MDVSLYYEEKGNGFPLILLHGNGEDHQYYVHQTEHFCRYYRVIALDTRGHGRSPRGKGDFSIKRFAEDLHDFMKEHGIEKADIVGFSDGGNIALYFAQKHPEMVRKLVLNGANLDPSGVKRSVQLPIELGYAAAKLFSRISEKAAKNAEMIGLMVNEPDIKPSELSSLKMPVLVIAGTKDMIKKKHTELIAKSIPGASLVFINGGHFIANNQSESFNRELERFLLRGN
ncbi:MAG: alpha/beta hydrolase [Firmicutes bacterium]|nr:alpha/beta hydrolase [Bacillota bacterium]